MTNNNKRLKSIWSTAEAGKGQGRSHCLQFAVKVKCGFITDRIFCNKPSCTPDFPEIFSNIPTDERKHFCRIC